MSSIGERLEKIRINLAITGKSFAEILEITPQGYINYSKNKRDIPVSIVLKINQMFKINSNWLLTGKGDMLQDTTSDTHVELSQQEAEIVQDYRVLEKDDQEIFYYELKTAALKARKKAKDTNLKDNQ